jgi:hypothetical protein
MIQLDDPGVHTVSIKDAAELVLSGKLQLPHFQRSFVWKGDRQLRLFQSVLEEFPMGSILLWKWNRKKGPANPFEIPSNGKSVGRASYLVIDGQQRLTTLAWQFCLANRPIKTWDFDGRTFKVLTIDLKSKDFARSFSWTLPRDARDHGSFVLKDNKVLVPGLLQRDYRAFVLDRLPSELQRRRAEQVRNRLVSAVLLFERLGTSTSMEDAVESFKLINSSGTKLGQIDLAAATVFAVYPQLSRDLVEFKRSVAGNDSGGEPFGVISLGLLLRCLLFEVFGSANPSGPDELKAKRLLTTKSIKTAWTRMTKAFRAFRDFLTNDLRLLDDAPLSQLSVLVAVQAFMRDSLSSADRNRLKRWIVLANIHYPYGGRSTNQRLDTDLRLMRSGDAIDWEELNRNLSSSSSGAPTRIQPSTFGAEGKTLPRTSIVHHLSWLLAHQRSATDWMTFAPIPSVYPGSEAATWDRHHIFPRKYMSERDDPKKLMNRIGNLAWLSIDTNRNRIRKRLPSDYLTRARLTSAGKTSLATQSVPEQPRLFGDPAAFIRKREEMLSKEMNELLELWDSGEAGRFDAATVGLRSAKTLIEADEQQDIELKESFWIEPSSRERMEALRHQVLKAIASFANAGGGFLLIGVTDSGAVKGIDWEQRALAGSDGRPREIAQILRRYVNDESHPKGTRSIAKPHLLEITPERLDGQRILRVQVYQSPNRVWIPKKPKDGGAPMRWAVYCRNGASTDLEQESEHAPVE